MSVYPLEIITLLNLPESQRSQNDIGRKTEKSGSAGGRCFLWQLETWLRRLLRSRPLLALGCVIFVSFLIHCLTLSRSPAVWIDEVMILDYGRVLSNRSTDWSVTVDQSGQPLIPCSPLYCWAEWQWVRYWAFSPFVARCFSGLWECAAAFAFFGLLRSLRVSRAVAVAFALAFYFDIVFTGSFRGARADACALTLAFVACHLWNRFIQNGRVMTGILAGALGTMAVLAWATAVCVLLLAPTMFFAAVWRRKRLHIDRIVCWRCLEVAR